MDWSPEPLHIRNDKVNLRLVRSEMLPTDTNHMIKDEIYTCRTALVYSQCPFNGGPPSNTAHTDLNTH